VPNADEPLEAPLPPAVEPLPPGGLEALWNDPHWRMASFVGESFKMVGLASGSMGGG
jgi:hypothetical protein